MTRPTSPRPRLAWLAAALLAAASSAACGKDEPSRWDAAASARTAAPPPGAAPAAEGGSFNRFFPPDGAEGAKRVFTQEKTGYAEAKLQQDGKDVATVSIADTTTNPEARDKFKAATEQVKGHPVMAVGKNQTTVLVKDRFQVKVSSPTLDDPARRAWLERFDFAGLEKLAAAGGK